jgi:very-short-patch-repair endonuclease
MEQICFQAVPVDGMRGKDVCGHGSKCVMKEAEEVIHIIEDLVEPKANSKYKLPPQVNPNKFSIGVISLIHDQCDAIITELLRKFPDNSLQQYGIDPTIGEGIGTPEKFQGDERDIMIFSLSLDSQCSGKGSHYHNENRLNVATSRARLFTYFVYSPFSENFKKIMTYLTYISDKKTIWSPRIEEFESKMAGFESKFEEHVYYYLKRFVDLHPNDGNIIIRNQVECCGGFRLDFVLYNRDNQKSVAIEVDGIQHFASNTLKGNYSMEHIERLNILKRAGWKIINTPYYKWYNKGWLSEETDAAFKDEIDRIYREIDKAL